MKTFLFSRIDRASVTGTNLDSDESITIDRYLMNAAGLLPYERVEIHNLTNGRQFATWVAAGDEGKGEVTIQGSGAHLAKKGDRLIVAAFCLLHEGQAIDHKPKLVSVDENNQVRELSEAKVK